MLTISHKKSGDIVEYTTLWLLKYAEWFGADTDYSTFHKYLRACHEWGPVLRLGRQNRHGLYTNETLQTNRETDKNQLSYHKLKSKHYLLISPHLNDPSNHLLYKMKSAQYTSLLLTYEVILLYSEQVYIQSTHPY